MKYLCTNCAYVYDIALWDEEEGIEVWIILDKCPVCQEYDTFQWFEEEVNYIDENNLYWLESEHNPEIEIKDDKIIVIVWEENHPMWETHRIASIGLYDEYWDLVEEKYLDIDSESIVEFDNYNFDEFEIRVKCSFHWVWWKKFLI